MLCKFSRVEFSRKSLTNIKLQTDKPIFVRIELYPCGAVFCESPLLFPVRYKQIRVKFFYRYNNVCDSVTPATFDPTLVDRITTVLHLLKSHSADQYRQYLIAP